MVTYLNQSIGQSEHLLLKTHGLYRVIGQLNNPTIKLFAWFRNSQCLLCNHPKYDLRIYIIQLICKCFLNQLILEFYTKAMNSDSEVLHEEFTFSWHNVEND